MQTLHISHNDLDGVSCGILISKFLPGSITTVYLNYDDIERYIDENVHLYDRIVITDVTPSFGTVEMLAGEKDVIIIDHHATSEALKQFHFTIHDITKSATLLTYEWLKSSGFKVDAYENLARCVNDVDMWHLKRKDSLQMGILFHLFGITKFEERFKKEPYTEFKESEQLFIFLEEERRDNYIKKAMRNMTSFKDINGFNVVAVFAELYNSELGNYIISEGFADYVIMINPQQKKASLRSSPDVDIRKIAERNKGGGHKNAAAFPLKQFDFSLSEILSKAGIL